jgi:hypothetical protein
MGKLVSVGGKVMVVGGKEGSERGGSRGGSGRADREM